MASKRKRSTLNDNNEAGPSQKRCSYCFKEHDLLVGGQSCCATCAVDSSHCNICYRPLLHSLVENGVCYTWITKMHKLDWEEEHL